MVINPTIPPAADFKLSVLSQSQYQCLHAPFHYLNCASWYQVQLPQRYGSMTTGTQAENQSPVSAGSQVISDFATYDSRGLFLCRITLHFLVGFCALFAEDTTKPFAKSQFDALGRLIQVINPDATTMAKSYRDWTETDTDANGHIKITSKMPTADHGGPGA